MEEEKQLGKFRGMCKDVHDPERLGRIRVSCPAIYGEEWSDWAYPNFPPNYFGLPDEGDMVWVEFEDGNPDYPIWTGCYFDREAPNPYQMNQPAMTDRDGQEVDHDKLEHETDPIDSVEREPFRKGLYYDPYITQLVDSLTGLKILINDHPDKGGGLYIRDRAGNEFTIRDDETSSMTLSDMNGNVITTSKDGLTLENNSGTKILAHGASIRFQTKDVYFDVPKGGVHLETVDYTDNGGERIMPVDTTTPSGFTAKVLNKVRKTFPWRTKTSQTDPTIK